MTVVRCGGKKGAGYCGNFNLAGSADDFWDPRGLFRCETGGSGFQAVEAQLKGWRRACALESAGLACLWLGLLLGLTLSPYGYALAVAGAAVFAACKAYLIKKYPYIDPDTVKKSGKKRKK